MLFMDKVELDENRIKQSTGFWFYQTVKGFNFNGLDHVLITTRVDHKGRDQEVWIAVYESGKRREVDPGDLWESNGERIIEYMTDNEIVVILE